MTRVISSFKLNNDNVTELVAAFNIDGVTSPRIHVFRIRWVTTVACLLPVSVHCVKLEKLQIHFNTTSVVDDLKSIPEVSQFGQPLRSRGAYSGV